MVQLEMDLKITTRAPFTPSKSLILWFILSSFFTLMNGCSGSGGGSEAPKIYYDYGNEVLTGVLSPLDDHYKPEGLSLKTFTKNGVTYAPMNMESQNLSLTFDVIQKKTLGATQIQYRSTQSNSHGIFQLDATILSAKLNGATVTISAQQDPDGLGQKYWSVDANVSTSALSTLELEYQLPEDRVTFTASGVRALTDMTDLYEAHFFESWGPVTFEQDAFQMQLHLKIVGGSNPHQLFTNGEAQKVSNTEWDIQFPNYFTMSSFYFHLTDNSNLIVSEMTIAGVEKNIPVTIYSSQNQLIQKAKAQIPSLFQEYERDFGPYPHNRFVVYLNGRGGGMEYSGATITSTTALDHELFHSWFARSVMPAEGRSGWIDEAMASWRDYGYFQAPSLLSRNPTRLSNFSPFRKSTPENCYRDGRQLIAELDRVLAEFGGMKVMMKLYFQRYKNRVVTNEEFWSFLQNKSLINLDPYFQRYTLGLNVRTQNQKLTATQNDMDLKTLTDLNIESHHPKPLTADEIRELR